MDRSCRIFGLILLASISGRADEGVRKDGTRTQGTLKLAATGRFTFQTAGATEPIDRLDLVRLGAKSPDAKLGIHHQVRLIRGQIVHGELLKLDEEHLYLRTGWANSLLIPRTLIERIRRAPTSPLDVTKPWADLTADGVRSTEGDETFGTIVEMSAEKVVLETKAKTLATRWSELAEIGFKRGTIAERETKGEHVQLRLRTVAGQRDILEGAVRSFDDISITLVHANFGELRIPRDRVAEVRFNFHGRCMPVDSTPRHLGNRPAFGFAVPKPEAMSFSKTATVEMHRKGFVVIDAAGLSEKGDRVEVRVNGKSIGELNRLVDRPDGEVKTLRLPLPALANDKPEIEVRVLADAEGRKISGVDLRGVRVEVVEAR